jgi:hypothetical protein
MYHLSALYASLSARFFEKVFEGLSAQNKTTAGEELKKKSYCEVDLDPQLRRSAKFLPPGVQPTNLPPLTKKNSRTFSARESLRVLPQLVLTT